MKVEKSFLRSQVLKSYNRPVSSVSRKVSAQKGGSHVKNKEIDLFCEEDLIFSLRLGRCGNLPSEREKNAQCRFEKSFS